MDTGRRVGERTGYTLVELMLTMALLGVLAAISIPQFVHFQERAEVAQVIVHLKSISAALEIHGAEHGTLPLFLVDIAPELAAMTDPWGAPYNYTRVEGAKKGKLRKDKFLVPINSDYDLWSNGPDGKTVMPLTAKPSRDDIIRASDGSYFGRAAAF
ncbi:MAG: prepilin-type N-terminal cleavage/methylation domain-containing protein [Deltaproteobacteria bacterium]|nr:prepilin-type N-terminal cleavage/methylation domain-containing protein [Deltaproteobacteria bacterium]MBW2361306.1 prepilin-type N-terminal cleavage/methylation domain-containing protein [Deltaproteobacteria bacterium]